MTLTDEKCEEIEDAVDALYYEMIMGAHSRINKTYMESPELTNFIVASKGTQTYRVSCIDGKWVCACNRRGVCIHEVGVFIRLISTGNAHLK